MEQHQRDELYHLLNMESDEDFENELMGWLDRGAETNANLMILEADWDSGMVSVYNDIDADWSVRCSAADLRQVIRTHLFAKSLEEDGTSSIGADHAEDLTNRYGVLVEDLVRMGFEVVPDDNEPFDPDASLTGRVAEVSTVTATSRQDVARIVHQMLDDLRDTGHEEWENNNLDRFLGALHRLLTMPPGVWGDEDTATWELFARFLVASTGYE